MLYIGYLIGMDGSNVKKTVSEISIFELHRLENCISRLCPNPLGTPPHTKKHPNRAKNTKKVLHLLSIRLCTEVEGLGRGPICEFSAPPPGQLPPACSEWRNRGTSWSRLCLFLTRPPVCQVSCGRSPRGCQRYGVGRPRGAIRRKGVPYWQPHRK